MVIRNLQGWYMHKIFKQLKNWDLTTMGYYSYLDFQNLDYIRKKFNTWTTRSNYSKKYNSEPKQIFKFYNPTENRTANWRDYRVNTFLRNKSDKEQDVPQLYVTQSETRSVHSKSIIMFLNLPLKYFRDDIKNTTYGYFDYDVVDKIFKRWNKNLTENEWTAINKEYCEKYPEQVDSEWIWKKNLEQDLYYSFKKYGQLNIPVIDRPYNIFKGSSHTLFHACYLKWDYLKVFIEVPLSVEQQSKDALCSGWYSFIPPNNFAPKQYTDSKMFYMFYFDLENENLYSKQYPANQFDFFKKNIKTLDKDLHKDWDVIL